MSGFSHWVAFEIIGVRYAVALAVFVGIVSQFIPVVGTYLAAALPALIALVSSPADAVWVLAFATAYQQVENYLLAPRITARTMALHPAVAFGTVIAGAGIIGADRRGAGPARGRGDPGAGVDLHRAPRGARDAR